METHPACTIAHGAAPVPEYHVADTTIDAVTGSHFSWEKWGPTDPSSVFPASFDVSYYPADEPQYNNLDPSYTTAFSPEWHGTLLPVQEYPIPPSTSGQPSSGQSPSISESLRGSVSTLPDARKRKRSTDKRTAAKSTARGSNRKNSSEAAVKEPARESKCRKAQHATVSGGSSPEHPVGEYNRRVQERNRVASNKFRVKKREGAKKLKADEEDMERINRDLSSCAADLTLEVYHLKIRLLQHTDCDCSLIQDYIANEAHRYVQDLGDEKEHGHGGW